MPHRLATILILLTVGTLSAIAVLSSQASWTVVRDVATPSARPAPNLNQVTTSAEPAVSSSIDFSEYIPPPLTRNFNYCVRLMGVPESYLSGLEAKLASVYTDPRGWSLGGALKFTEVSSGCNFTVTLAAAADLPSYNSICSTVYSCTVGNNVILNFDRWSGGSAPWNGPLEDYRALVINHETGHWLGFGHLHCSAPGVLAPVMQQQSIDLEGCVINAWPLPSERQTLANRYGIKL